MCACLIRTDQLSEIRKTTFAAIICDNSGEIESVQLHVMHSSRKVGNGRVGCDSLIKMSLNPWKENVVPVDATAAANAIASNDNNDSSKSADEIGSTITAN